MRLPRTALYGILTLCSATGALGQPNTWSQKANFANGPSAAPTARYGAACFSIGTKGYIGTGYDGVIGSRKDFWEYDTATDAWTQKADFGGEVRYRAVGFAIGSKGYIGTGLGGNGAYYLSDFWEYDPIVNTWTQRAPFGGTARQLAVGFSIGAKGYIGTGWDGVRKRDFWEYDPALNTWTQKALFGGTARYFATGFSVGTKGYIGTGDDGTYRNDFWEYDPATNSWLQRANFGGAPRMQAAGFSIDALGYIGTGLDQVSYKFDFWAFDPATNTWAQRADFTGMEAQEATSLAIGNKGYVGLGYTSSPTFMVKDEFLEFDPAMNAWSKKAEFGGKARQQAVAFSIGAKGYVGTGQAGSIRKDLWEFDPATNAWSQKADYGGGFRYGAVGFSIGSKGYVGTGRCGNSNCYTNDFWEYDPATNAWTQRPNFPGTVRSLAVGFSVGSKGYIGLGGNNFLSPYAWNDVWEFDPATNTWTQKAFFPGGPRDVAVGFGIGTKGYVGTGGNWANDFWEFDPVANTWTQKTSLPGPGRTGAVGFSIGAKGYIGTGKFFSTFLNDFWEYEPITNTWTQKADLPADARHLAVGFSIGTKGYIGTGANINALNMVDLWAYSTGSDLTCNAPGATWCSTGGPSLPLSYTTAIAFNPGNTFTAQLSDASGSFASPTAIGSVSSILSGFINCTIPPLAPAGAGYRIRVVSTDPIIIGSDNGSDLTINTTPLLGAAIVPVSCTGENDGSINLELTGWVGTAVYDWTSSVDCLFNAQCPPALGNCQGGFCTGTNTSEDLTGLVEGTYTVTATLGGCVASQSFTVGVSTSDIDNDGTLDCLDLCPLGPESGSSCDDGDPNTINDTVVDCVCVGEVITCSDTFLQMTTDANASTQTSWQVREAGTPTVVCQNPGPLPNGAVDFPYACCLPNGCYELEVFDQGGDGLLGGGYRLVNAAGQRIIDNSNSGAFSTSTFTGFTAGVDAGSPYGFCLPVGNDRLVHVSCDKTWWRANEHMAANENPAVSAIWSAFTSNSSPQRQQTGYEFWYFDPNGSFTYRKFRNHSTGDGAGSGALRACYNRVTAVIPEFTKLNVKVRARLYDGSNTLTVYPWGPACRFVRNEAAALCPPTKLMDLPGNAFFSCGVTKTWATNQYLHARPVSGATQYQFRFRNDAETYNVTRTTSSYFVQLGWNAASAMVPALGAQYKVDVRAFVGGTWCALGDPWGDFCNVTLVSPMQAGGGQNMATEEETTQLNIWPNPNAGDQLWIGMEPLAQEISTVSLDIYTLTGQRALAQTIPVQGGQISTVVDLGRQLSAGMYLVNITAGDKVHTQRLIVQP